MRWLMVGLFAAVLGCGDGDRSVQGPSVGDSDAPSAKTQAQADARAELAERGISFTGASFLEWAGEGDLDLVELFVEGGMPVETVSFGGWTALHLAARNGHLEVVEFLLGQGASVGMETENGSTALDLARRGGHGEVARYLARAANAARAELAELGIDYTEQAFLDSAYAGNLEVVQLFVEAGMSVNTADGLGEMALYYALYYAADGGSLELVHFLVEQGADVDATTDWGSTVLHYAARGGSLELVRYLVGLGMDVSAARDNGQTVLHAATAHGQLEVVKYLVGQGAAVDARDDTGRTPRDVAVSCSSSGWYPEALRENCRAVVEYFDSL